VADELGDNHLEREGTLVAYRGGEVAGFTIAIRLDDPKGVPWIFLRLGVAEGHRRHGVGSALLERVAERAQAKAPIREITIGAWRDSAGPSCFLLLKSLLHNTADSTILPG